MTDCIFCKIANHKVPSKIEMETDSVVAFPSISPAAEIHMLIVPKEHVENFMDLEDLHKEVYQKANALEKAEQEGEELKILQEFLPVETSDEDLQKFVTEALSETGATDIKQMGMVIAKVMQKSQGNADGAKVAALVKLKL